MGVSYMVICYNIGRCCIFDDIALLPFLISAMKNKLKFLYLLLAFGLMLISVAPAQAQCAMCSATVESNAQGGNKTTNGLNNGIMYLLAAPYLAVAVVGYIWYKKYRRKNVELNMRNEKLHLN
jgi:hypothetical protein